MKLNRESLVKNIDEIAKSDLSAKKLFGSAYFVFQEDNLELERYYGSVSLNSSTQIDDSVIFRLASMTKPITAVATLILESQGLLSLDDTLDKYLPEYKNVKIKDINGNETIPNKIPTIRNILSHSAGIASDIQKSLLMTDKDRESLDATVAFHINEGLDYEPGTSQRYSGTGSFTVLTKIIELVSKTDYLSFLKKEIFEPCDMPDTSFILTESQEKRLIDMHQKINEESSVFKFANGCIFEEYPYTNFLGGAGLFSTLHDYKNFAKMLLNNGIFNGKVIVPHENLKQLTTVQISKEIMPEPERWGLGVRIIDENRYPFLPVGSFGWSGAYGSHFWIDPVNKIIGIFMKNSKIDGGSGNASAVAFERAVYSSFEK